tara:strand:+ start:239 stop:766 length:528 start_codon:yes stop_codon:yes gene_type:complete
MARRKYMNGLKRHPSHYRNKSPMLHDSFMNHEHPHKESEALDNVYGNVQMHPDLEKNIKEYMTSEKHSRPTSQSTSKTSKKQTPENKLDGAKSASEFAVKQTLKRLTKSAVDKVPTIGNVTKTVSKFAKGLNFAAMMFDPLSAGEGSTLYTYKDGKKYYNHGPNKGQEVPNSGLF